MNRLRLEARNFGSFGLVGGTVVFDGPGVVVIEGRNEDVAGERRNGAGKSMVLHAIFYALFGDLALPGLRPSALVNSVNGGDMRVCLVWERPGLHLEVERGRRPEVLSWRVIDGEGAVTAGGGGRVREEQERLERAAGLDRTAFEAVAVHLPGRAGIFDAPASERRALIETVIGSPQLSERADRVRARLSRARTALQSAKADLEAFAALVERRRRDAEERRRRAAAEAERRRRRIDELERRLAEHADFDLDEELRRHRHNAELAERLEQRRRLAIEADDLLARVRRTEQALDAARDDLKRARDDRCPSCGAQLDPTRIARLERQIRELETTRADLAERARRLGGRLADLDREIEEIGERGRPWPTLTPDVEAARGRAELIETWRRELDELRAAEAAAVVEHAEASEDADDAEERRRRTAVEICERDVKALTLLRDLLLRDESPVRRRILRARIADLDRLLEVRLRAVGFEGGARVTDALDVELDGGATGWGTLSRGERVRLDLAWRLACHAMLLRAGRLPPLLLLDETLDVGLDADGVLAALGTVVAHARETGSLVLLASNRDEALAAAPTRVRVVRRGGFSAFERPAT